MGEWIKCSERLPEDCESVLIWSKDMTITSAYLTYYQDRPLLWIINDWDEGDRNISPRDVTHWMPLPKEPEVKYD